jgi:hypothetical protein
MSEPGPRATFRNPSEADAPQLLDLLLRVFHRWPKFEIEVPPLEHLLWKMRSDPIAARHQWVAVVDGEIVAMMLRIVRRVRLKGRDHVVREGVDAAIDPRYEGQRLFGAMLDQALTTPHRTEVDLNFSFTTNPRMLRRSVRVGGRFITNPIQVLEKPCRARAIVARRKEKHGGRLPAPLAVLRIELKTAWNRLRHPPCWRRAKRAWSIDTLERFGDRTDRFFDEAARPFDFLVVRRQDFMNWRYCDPAAARFTVRVAEREGSILGYLILKISEGEGYIADLLALPGRVDVVRSLIDDALRIFREAGVERVHCWMIARHPYNAVLRRYGFMDSGSKIGFTYMADNLDDEALAFVAEPGARIHLTHGDSDWI